MSVSSPNPKQDGATAASISSLHPHILEAHILNRLDGPTLASATCSSTTLFSLAFQSHLWSHICRSTWPSTSSPRLQQLINNFPGGAASFFSQSYPLPLPNTLPTLSPAHPLQLISAVDIHYKSNLIFSKVEETETVSSWFRCSPFRIDLLDPKHVVPTKIQHPDTDPKCTDLMEDVELDWVLIDPTALRSLNLSSHKPVSVDRHWLTGEVQLRFASILWTPTAHVQCGIVVTCCASHKGEMQVMEVSLEMEDIDGMHLNGKDSLVILQRALEGKKGKGRKREEEMRRRYKDYLEMKRERKERKMRTEGRLDMLCSVLGVSLLAAFCFFIFCT